MFWSTPAFDNLSDAQHLGLAPYQAVVQALRPLWFLADVSYPLLCQWLPGKPGGLEIVNKCGSISAASHADFAFNELRHEED